MISVLFTLHANSDAQMHCPILKDIFFDIVF